MRATMVKKKPKLPKGVKKVVVEDEPDTQVVKLTKEEPKQKKELKPVRYKDEQGKYAWKYE